MDDVTSFSDGIGINGYVVEEYVKCGKPNCRCARGQLHGPYHYRRFHMGRSHFRQYIRKADVAKVREECARYRRFQGYLAANRARVRELYAVSNAMLRNLRRPATDEPTHDRPAGPVHGPPHREAHRQAAGLARQGRAAPAKPGDCEAPARRTEAGERMDQ